MNYINAIDTYFSQEVQKERKQGHHPSSASAVIDGKLHGGCLRQTYWKWNNEPASNPPDTSAKIKMQFGNLIHEWLQKKVVAHSYPDAIFEKQFELRVPGLTYPIIGSPDVIIPSQNEGIEIKSAYGVGIRQIKENGPKPEHIIQATLYHEMTKIPSWEFLYIGRDNSDRVQHHLNYKPEIFASAVERFKKLEEYLLKKALPPRDYKVIISETGEIVEEQQRNKIKYKSAWQCSYCPFLNACWKNAKPVEGITIPEKEKLL